MYDVTREQTFENVKKWLALVSQFGRGDVEIAIVGNKCDIVEMADSGGDSDRSTLNKRAITESFEFLLEKSVFRRKFLQTQNCFRYKRARRTVSNRKRLSFF